MRKEWFMLRDGVLRETPGTGKETAVQIGHKDVKNKTRVKNLRRRLDGKPENHRAQTEETVAQAGYKTGETPGTGGKDGSCSIGYLKKCGGSRHWKPKSFSKKTQKTVDKMLPMW